MEAVCYGQTLTKKTRSFFAHNQLQLPSSVSYRLNGRLSYKNEIVNTNIREKLNNDTQRKSISRTEAIIVNDIETKVLFSGNYIDEGISRIKQAI